MAQQVVRGGQIKLVVKFYEYVGGPPIDPQSDIQLDILKDGSSVLAGPILYPGGGITRKSTGIYEYTYSVDANADLGEYIARWSGTIYNATIYGDEAFSVVVAGSINPGTEPSSKLGEDYVINYTGELDPAFLDPDEMLGIYPEAEAADILESIHYVSLEVAKWLPGATIDNLPPLAYEYMRAAVACDLSQRFGYGDGEEYSITLGDLSVTNRNIVKGSINRGNAVTWCEIAAALRKEMLLKLTPMRGVVRGAKLDNPMPRRSIYKDNKTHPQGTLDDVKKPPSHF